MIGIDAKETVRFSVESDRGEKKTVFVLGLMTQRDRISVFGEAVGKDGKVSPQFIQEKAYEIFLKGCRKIENLVHADQVVEAIDEAVLDAIPFEVLMEVVAKIMEINFAGGAERKN